MNLLHLPLAKRLFASPLGSLRHFSLIAMRSPATFTITQGKIANSSNGRHLTAFALFTRTCSSLIFLLCGVIVLPVHARGGYLGGQYYPYCEQGVNANGHGNFTFCINGANYRIQYVSGTWIQSYCGSGQVYFSRNLQAAEAQWFHSQVCPHQGGSNANDVMIQMMKMIGQQYNYF